MIIIIFGLAAAGKTYIGKTISDNYNFYHEDADLWLSDDMQNYVKDQKHFTSNMLDDFTKNIIANIENLKNKHKNIAISQALYRTINRNTIKEYFESKGINILFIQIEASDEVIYQRLVSRGDWILPNYAASMRKFFQPMPEAIIIKNNQVGNEAIIEQLENIPEIAQYKKK